MKRIVAGLLLVGTLAILAFVVISHGPWIPLSPFANVQLHEPFTLVYRANGPLIPGGPNESTVTISASDGKLLYYVHSDNDSRITLAIYDGHETRSSGEYGISEAQINQGFCYDQFYTMPLPGVGLPYVPIARHVYNFGGPPISKLPASLRSRVARSRAQFKQQLAAADHFVSQEAPEGGPTVQDMEEVPGQGIRDTLNHPVPYAPAYGGVMVGWTRQPAPRMQWLVASKQDTSPLYGWIYQKHTTFEGVELASRIHFTHFPGGFFNKRTDCTLTLLSSTQTPLPADCYSLEKYMSHYTQIDDYRFSGDRPFQYFPGRGSISDQEARSPQP